MSERLIQGRMGIPLCGEMTGRVFSTDVIVPTRGAAVLSRRYRRVSFYVVPAKGCVSSRQALTTIAKRACRLSAAGLKGIVIAARSAALSRCQSVSRPLPASPPTSSCVVSSSRCATVLSSQVALCAEVCAGSPLSASGSRKTRSRRGCGGRNRSGACGAPGHRCRRIRPSTARRGLALLLHAVRFQPATSPSAGTTLNTRVRH